MSVRIIRRAQTRAQRIPEVIFPAPKPITNDWKRLYRHLLRTAGYLPDSTARSYARTETQAVFRANMEKLAALRRRKNSGVDIAKRTTAYFARGKMELRVLLRACNGERDALLKVLQESYGRRGRYRRQLVAALISNEQDTVPASDTALNEFLTDAGKPHQSLYPTRKLLSFMKSQLENQAADRDGPRIRGIVPSIPKLNIWGEPLPGKLQASTRAKFWVKAFDSVLPPLPASQWDRLQALSEGTLRWHGPPPRRPLASTPVAASWTSAKLLWVRYNDNRYNPLRRWESERSSTPQSERFPEYDPASYSLDARAMRRLWGTVWLSCSKMTFDEVRGVWEITWGQGASTASRGEVTQPSARDVELFEGVKDLPQDSKPKQSREMKARLKRMERKNSAATAV
ncbi:LYR motif protein [Phlyctema vagabunda]|uniref:LYR motif protein n=1 Tax=Phlyctema vagabunda TaxID=108571 RepID=A0ABR4P5A2_9HELO